MSVTLFNPIHWLCLRLTSKLCSPTSPSPKSWTFWLWSDLWRHQWPLGQISDHVWKVNVQDYRMALKPKRPPPPTECVTRQCGKVKSYCSLSVEVLFSLLLSCPCCLGVGRGRRLHRRCAAPNIAAGTRPDPSTTYKTLGNLPINGLSELQPLPPDPPSPRFRNQTRHNTPEPNGARVNRRHSFGADPPLRMANTFRQILLPFEVSEDGPAPTTSSFSSTDMSKWSGSLGGSSANK